MFPESQHGPALGFQGRVDQFVALSVFVYLAVPELRVGLRPHAMSGTPVPEAAVDENGDSGSWEGDVWAAHRSNI